MNSRLSNRETLQPATDMSGLYHDDSREYIVPENFEKKSNKNSLTDAKMNNQKYRPRPKTSNPYKRDTNFAK
jgi:hypothetical protein